MFSSVATPGSPLPKFASPADFPCLQLRPRPTLDTELASGGLAQASPFSLCLPPPARRTADPIAKSDRRFTIAGPRTAPFPLRFSEPALFLNSPVPLSSGPCLTGPECNTPVPTATALPANIHILRDLDAALAAANAAFAPSPSRFAKGSRGSAPRERAHRQLQQNQKTGSPVAGPRTAVLWANLNQGKVIPSGYYPPTAATSATCN
jgi:hypothetical protein